MIFKTTAYGVKNFYKQLGLSQHFSLRGLLRRWERQRPVLFRLSKFVLIYTVITTSSMLFLPGTMLPLQKWFKLFAVARAEQVCRFWYLNSLVSDQVGYVLAMYRLIFYILDQGMEDERNIAKYIDHVNRAVKGEYVVHKASNHANIESISNSVLLLKKILMNHQKHSRKESLLKSKLFVSKINDIFCESAVHSKGRVDEIDKSNFALCLKLIEYLLKFEVPDKRLEILSNFKLILKDGNKKFIVHLFLKDEAVKKQIKRVYNENIECRPIIMQILAVAQQERIKSLV